MINFKFPFREEAEKKRQEELENARRQKEEIEKEQEALRKRMIEERLVSLYRILQGLATAYFVNWNIG